MSIRNDDWVLSLASNALKEIGLTNYKFQISNRKILKGILEELQIDNSKDVMKYLKSKGYGAKIYFEEDSLKKK